MKARLHWVMFLPLLVFGDCRSIDEAAPEVRGGSLSPRDLAYVRSIVKEQKLPLRWIEVAGQQVHAYTEDKRGGGIVYAFWRGEGGHLEGGVAGLWD